LAHPPPALVDRLRAITELFRFSENPFARKQQEENLFPCFLKTSTPAFVTVIAIIQQKGGVGKSTITANLAGELVEKKLIVRVLDLDPQQSLATWARLGGGVLSDIVGPVSVESAKEFKAVVAEAADQAERVILDCPPGLPDTGMMAALLADIVLLPVTPSPLDVIASKKALELIRQVQEQRKGGLPIIAYVPSKLVHNTILARDLESTLKPTKERILPGISQRIAIAESVLQGLTLREYAPTSEGVGEFKELATAVERMLKR
jgi:chromosome partitioning protein